EMRTRFVLVLAAVLLAASGSPTGSSGKTRVTFPGTRWVVIGGRRGTREITKGRVIFKASMVEVSYAGGSPGASFEYTGQCQYYLDPISHLPSIPDREDVLGMEGLHTGGTFRLAGKHLRLEMPLNPLEVPLREGVE